MESLENADGAEPAAPPQKKLWHAGSLTYTAGGLVLLGFWLLWGDFPWALKDRAVGPAATLLIKRIGVSEFVYGLVIVSFPNFTNLFLSPIISYLSDRHRGRWGRRIPFLLFTTPFIVAGLFVLGYTVVLGGWLHGLIPSIPVHAAQLVFFCIAWVLLDFGTTLSSSLFSALANDVIPHELLGRFFSLFRMVSLGAGMIFNAWLIDKVETHTPIIFLGIGTLYGVGLLSLCWRVKEGGYPPVQEEPAGVSGQYAQSVFLRVMRSVIVYFRQSFSLPYYRWYMLSQAAAMLAFAPINFFSIQYAQKLGIGMDRYGLFLVATYLFSFVASYFFGMLSDRFNPLRCGLVGLAAYLVLMAAGWGFLADAGWFGPIFILHGIISGSYFTATASLGPRLLPKALFAQFSSATGIVIAIGSMIAGPVIGMAIDCLDHDYRWLFLFGGAITLTAFLLLIKVYRDYLRFGGDKAYEPPMPE